MNFFFKYVTETVDSPFMVKKSIWVRNDEISANGVSTSLNPSQHALSMINDKAVIDLGIDHDRSFRGLSEWCIYLEIRRCVLLLFRASKLKVNEETKKSTQSGNKQKRNTKINRRHAHTSFLYAIACTRVLCFHCYLALSCIHRFENCFWHWISLAVFGVFSAHTKLILLFACFSVQCVFATGFWAIALLICSTQYNWRRKQLDATFFLLFVFSFHRHLPLIGFWFFYCFFWLFCRHLFWIYLFFLLSSTEFWICSRFVVTCLWLSFVFWNKIEE